MDPRLHRRSAFKGTINAGYGSRIQHPDRTCDELFDSCGTHCSNFDAEALAIEASLHHLLNTFTLNEEKRKNVVIFSDAKSVLQALDNGKLENKSVRSLAKTITHFINAGAVRLTLQWIPGHANIQGNERADKLAKQGSTRPQVTLPTSINTARQTIKTNKREEWMNGWAMGKTGRPIFNHMTAPNLKDGLNSLERRDQVTIFRLRSQHIPLNAHLNRIRPESEPNCLLCPHPYETVAHLLFECPALQDLRENLLPPSPDVGNTLYTNPDQLRKTSHFFVMATSRRARAQMTAGSEK